MKAFLTTQISGKGRGKLLGIPTINLLIPKNLNLEDGIYAVLVKIDGETFKGALHCGPIPVFMENEKSLEVLLIDVSDENLPETFNKSIEIEVKQKLRDVQNFETPEKMVEQIRNDIKEARIRLETKS
jgi:riboflavin kinase / FMN adenylyltransferase